MKDRRIKPRLLAVILALLFCRQVPLAAQDTVIVASRRGGQVKVTGRILDFTGRRLQVELADGQRQGFDAQRVLRIETQYTDQQTRADALLAEHRFPEALALYRQALHEESRRWVRRRILAAQVRCYRALDQLDLAGATFLLLVSDDPETLDFDCIPLAWATRPLPVALEDAARGWMQREEPAAKLLGASHLLTSGARQTAIARLRRLSTDPDRRIAQLATAQGWRATVTMAEESDVDSWQRMIQQMPEPLAAGPYYVLGLARLQRGHFERAALALMRVPILYPNQRRLAGRSLLEAGRALEQLGRIKQAAGLFRELITNYPEDQRLVAEAKSRLETLGQGP